MESDPRGGEPPADNTLEEDSAEGSDGPAATDEPGPQGNPEVDEEALEQRQQESG